MSALTVEVLDKTGYRLMLDTSDPEDEARLQNIEALLGSIAARRTGRARSSRKPCGQPPPTTTARCFKDETEAV